MLGRIIRWRVSSLQDADENRSLLQTPGAYRFGAKQSTEAT